MYIFTILPLMIRNKLGQPHIYVILKRVKLRTSVWHQMHIMRPFLLCILKVCWLSKWDVRSYRLKWLRIHNILSVKIFQTLNLQRHGPSGKLLSNQQLYANSSCRCHEGRERWGTSRAVATTFQREFYPDEDDDLSDSVTSVTPDKRSRAIFWLSTEFILLAPTYCCFLKRVKVMDANGGRERVVCGLFGWMKTQMETDLRLESSLWVGNKRYLAVLTGWHLKWTEADKKNRDKKTGEWSCCSEPDGTYRRLNILFYCVQITE